MMERFKLEDHLPRIIFVSSSINSLFFHSPWTPHLHFELYLSDLALLVSTAFHWFRTAPLLFPDGKTAPFLYFYVPDVGYRTCNLQVTIRTVAIPQHDMAFTNGEVN